MSSKEESSDNLVVAPEKKLETALNYVDHGWPVFPVHTTRNGSCTCGIRECESVGKHPVGKLAPNGFKNATTDPKQVEKWWKSGHWNIGIATGKDAGITVIDPDGPHAMALFSKYMLTIPMTLQVTTPHGHHIYVDYNPALKQGARLLEAGDECGCEKKCGIDVRNDGGYVVAPGSVINGAEYTWINDYSILPWPEVVTVLVRNEIRTDRPEDSSPKNSNRVAKALREGVRGGKRNDTAAMLAGYFHTSENDADIVLETLKPFADKCRPPLDHRELKKVVDSICKRETRGFSRGFGGGFSINGNGCYELNNGFYAVSEVSTPEFPIDSIPEPFRTYITDCAASIGQRADFVAVPMLAFIGGIIGDRYGLQLKQDFTEYPSLWVALVAPSGAGKTPAINAARRPLDMLQQRAKQRYSEELGKWLDAKEQAADNDQPFSTPKPRMDHFYTTDATIEALATLIDSSPGTVVHKDELVGWIAGMDAYKAAGRGGERQSFLSIWSSSPIKIDRKTQEPITIDKPVAPVVGGIQPHLLHRLAGEAEVGDGFLQRMFFIKPPVAQSRWSTVEVSDEQVLDIANLLEPLRTGEVDQRVLLDKEAWVRWHQWYNETHTAGFGIHHLLSGWYSKLPLQVARIALILHCMKHPKDAASHRLELETLNSAIAVGEYFRQHAHIVLAAFGATTNNQHSGIEAKVLKLLADQGWMKEGELNRKLPSNVPSEQKHLACQSLVRAGAIERQEVRNKKGGRPTFEYRLAAKTGETATTSIFSSDQQVQEDEETLNETYAETSF